MTPTCRDSDLRVVRQTGEGDRALGYAETVHRLTGIMSGGWGHNLEYLRGVEEKLTATLNRVREALGNVETLAHLKQQETDR